MSAQTQLAKANDHKELKNIRNEPEFKTASEEWKRLDGDEMRLTIKQGEILNRISTLYGKEGFEAFCKGNKISERKAYETLVIYQYRDHELSDIIMGLTHRKAFTFSRLIKQVAASDDESVKFTDGTSVSKHELKAMSSRELDAFTSDRKKYERQLKSKDKEHEKAVEKLEKQIEDARKDYAKLESALDELHLTQVDVFLTSATRLLNKLRDVMEYTISKSRKNGMERKTVQWRSKLIGEIKSFSDYLCESNEEFLEHGQIIDEPENIEETEAAGAGAETMPDALRG